MSTQEFYIREKEEQEARGPFGFAQMAGMVAQGEVSGETLFFDGAKEDWVPLSDCGELKSYFPEQAKRAKLKLRAKSEERSSNEIADEQTEAVSVRELLVETSEGSGGGAKAMAQLKLGAAVFLPVAAGLIGAKWGTLAGFDFGEILREPLLLIGVILALCFPFVFFGSEDGGWNVLRGAAAFGLGAGGLVLAATGGAISAGLLAAAMLCLIVGSFLRGNQVWYVFGVAFVLSALLCGGMLSGINQ